MRVYVVAVWSLTVALVLGGVPATAWADPAVLQANCAAFAVSGNPRSATGANWTYRSTDQGVRYVLEGVLFVPPTGSGPFPAVVVSHGKGGTPRGYSATIARTMVGWGMVAIGTMYTHAPDAEDLGNAPDGPDGASPANVQRAHKTRELLACVAAAHVTRVAAHGHSMGAFVTGQVLGIHPGDFRAASHTAGGVGDGPNATKRAAAEQIVTPYQLHHGDADQVVPLALDRTLDGILTANGVPHQLRVYPGYDHQAITFDAVMLSRVRTWYQTHGVLHSGG
jgi:dienelactone hydrolase